MINRPPSTDSQPPTTDHRLPTTHSWKNDFYLWLPLACVSWWLAWKYQDRFISDWDGFDYTASVVEETYSVLGLGRALFLGYNRLLWQAASSWFHWPPEQVYLLIRYGVIAQTGVAIIGIYALCKELSASKLSAFFSALIVVASPYFITYSGRAMSEIPGFLMLSWSLWWMLRGLRLGRQWQFLMAAFLVGLSANVREFAVFYFPFVALAAWWRGVKWRTVALALALTGLAAGAGILFWYLRDGNLYRDAVITWYRLSAEERRRFPVSINNIWFLGKFTFIASATVAVLVPLALAWLASKRRLRLLWMFGLCGLLADLVLLLNHDLPVNPRYALTGLLGLAAVSGWCLAELLRGGRIHNKSANLASVQALSPQRRGERRGSAEREFESQTSWSKNNKLKSWTEGAQRVWRNLCETSAELCASAVKKIPGSIVSRLTLPSFSWRGVLILLSLIVMTKATWNYEAKELYSAEWNANGALRFIAQVERLPWNTGFIVGQRSPLIHYFSAIGVQPYWRTISPGSGWPDGKLDKAIADFFYAGREVYIDFDPEIWQTGVRENSREAAGLEMIRRHYELKFISDNFYQVLCKKPGLAEP
ncbi:MAG: glycosyltransferase family 39 protein [Blastocatellia bacterium]